MVDPQWSLEVFMYKLKQQPEVQIQTLSLVNERRRVYYLGPPQLTDQARLNRDNKMKNVQDNREEIEISDPGLIFTLPSNIILS
ncbi:hypothetical protein HOY80DRAFT_1044267 [Tuber brumale]|nr:hypothetical protein HOY80DRAFT_1044267 [Tuber brumale]